MNAETADWRSTRIAPGPPGPPAGTVDADRVGGSSPASPQARRTAAGVPELGSLREVAHLFDAVVLDQWGVLHDGSRMYPGAGRALEALRAEGIRLAVLSNSGKRATANAARIRSFGFREGLFDLVMTSGEAYWLDIASGRRSPGAVFAIAGAEGDPERWAAGLDLSFARRLDEARTVLLMGVAEGSDGSQAWETLEQALARGLPLVCTNPDVGSPRRGGVLQTSPGALARDYRDAGGSVTLYGKPGRTVFDRVACGLGAEPSRLLMVGDSLEHDIAGGFGAGWRTALVRGGLHAAEFAANGSADALARLTMRTGCPPPDYTIASLR